MDGVSRDGLLGLGNGTVDAAEFPPGIAMKKTRLYVKAHAPAQFKGDVRIHVGGIGIEVWPDPSAQQDES